MGSNEARGEPNPSHVVSEEEKEAIRAEVQAELEARVQQLKDHTADVAVSVAEAAPAEEEEEITLTAAEEAAAMEVFALLDVDNSGFIEHNEVDVLFGGAANRERFFDWVDANGDHKISPIEWQTHVRQRKVELRQDRFTDYISRMKETIQAKITEVQSIKAAAAEDQVAVAPTKLERRRRQSRDLKAALEQAEEDGVCAAAAAPEQPASNSAPGPARAEEEGVRGSSTHVDLNNLKDSGTGELSAEEFAALRAKTKSAAEV